jgi:hypothetical protein
MYCPWLNEGVTTDIFGHSLPFMMRSRSRPRSYASKRPAR